MKERAIQPMHGFHRGMASPMACRSHFNFNSTTSQFVGLDRSQDAVDRIGEVAIELVLELSVSQDREEFRNEFEFCGPRFVFGRIQRRCFRLGGRDGTLRIVRGDRTADKLFKLSGKLKKQSDSLLRRTVCKDDGLMLVVRLMNRRERLLHITRPAFVRRRCGKIPQHETIISNNRLGSVCVSYCEAALADVSSPAASVIIPMGEWRRRSTRLKPSAELARQPN